MELHKKCSTTATAIRKLTGAEDAVVAVYDAGKPKAQHHSHSGLCPPNERGLDLVAVEERDVLFVGRPAAGRDVKTEPLECVEEERAPHADRNRAPANCHSHRIGPIGLNADGVDH